MDRLNKVDEKIKKKYLYELQKFLDLLDNIQDEKMKKIIIYQMIEYKKSLINLIESGNATKE